MDKRINNITDLLKDLRRNALGRFSEEEVKAIESWEEDDGGVDLESFLPDSVVSEDIIWNLQVIICAINEISYLRSRDKQLMALEASLKWFKKQVINDDQ